VPLKAVNRAAAGDVEIAYESFGDPADPPVVLVMGLGVQMLGWREGFCAGLAERGCFVVRFDNRDTGLSTHLHGGPPPDLEAAFAGDASSAAYTLSDMARDTGALLDALGLDSAHLVGASMGAMIAQTVAIEHPDRVRSLTSMLSTTGDPAVGHPSEAALSVLFAPPASSREEAIERAVATYRVTGSPGFDFDEEGIRERAGIAYDRAHDPSGSTRQLVAILASGDRTERLGSVGVPTLVMHGAADVLVDPSGGRATAAAIPGAELVLLDGVGHDLPEALWPELIERIAAVVRRAERSRTV